MTDRKPPDIRGTYDRIATEYSKSTELPLRVHFDEPSLLRLAEPLDGKSVLDLACGDGHYTRLVKQAGAGETLGIDLSSEMVALAEAEERRTPIGCRYQTGNASNLALGKTFDLVVSVYLLNYARTKAELLDFCKTIRRHLKPGGRFVGLTLNITLDPAHYADGKHYGVWFTGPARPQEGDPLTVHIANTDGSTASFDNSYLKPATSAEAAAVAGLRDFAWRPLQVSEEGLAAFPSGYWDCALAYPITIGVQARRGA
ncbi:MAG: class I SAM-dependent methyltransferase [Pseudomonadota bacterium]